MGRLETSGYKGWWPMKKITGRDENGNFKYQEVFVNMARSREGGMNSRRFETYAPAAGWNGEPPYPTGELTGCRHVSEAYRRNYDLIVWDRDREPQEGNGREYDVSEAVCGNCGHEFAAIYDVFDHVPGEIGQCPQCGEEAACLKQSQLGKEH